MKYRMLKNGRKAAEANESVQMTIDSKCPQKWAFVDMETGDIWVHKSRITKKWKVEGDFYSADKKALEAIKHIMLDRLYTELGWYPSMK